LIPADIVDLLLSKKFEPALSAAFFYGSRGPSRRLPAQTEHVKESEDSRMMPPEKGHAPASHRRNHSIKKQEFLSIIEKQETIVIQPSPMEIFDRLFGQKYNGDCLFCNDRHKYFAD
jgi:hypothetical protein